MTPETSRDRRVAVVGAGGHAKVVISTLDAAGFEVVAVYDDDPARHGDTVLGVPIRGHVGDLAREDVLPAVIAIGDNHVRRRIAERLAWPWVSVVHPSAVVHASVRLGPGTVVMAGAVIQPDARLGRHAIVNTAATVDHDCRLGDFVHVAPGAHLAGSVALGDEVLLGIGAVVTPGRRIGAGTVVGAGAAVVCDMPSGVVARGVPAKAYAAAPHWSALGRAA